jgi:squalene synthase HpnC
LRVLREQHIILLDFKAQHLLTASSPTLSAQASIGHYENFPVASVLVPQRYRPAIAAIYHFARGADDIADEGDADDATRLAALAAWRAQVARIAAGEPPHAEPAGAVFAALHAHVRAENLPCQLLDDLLDAFMQDVTKKRYADIDDLKDYCRRSANPVGRLLLHLYGVTDANSLTQSDAICTSLQLINFWQDVEVDWRKQRIYLPQTSLEKFGLSEADIASHAVEKPAYQRFSATLRFEVERARDLMQEGAPLVHALPGRLGWELRLVVQGGLRILERIEQADYDVFRKRPVLGAWDWLVMLVRAVRM